MPLNHTFTRAAESYNMPLHPDFLSQTGVTRVLEGMALINSISGGVGRVRPATGTAADGAFIGVSAEINNPPQTAVYVEIVTVPSSSPYTVNLISPIIATTAISVRSSPTSSLDIVTGSPSGGDVQVTANSRVLTFNSAQAGDTFTATYRFSPTVQQTIALFGDGNVLGTASPSQIANGLTVITKGIVYTDQFDPADNWEAPNIGTIHVEANGLFTRAGGADIAGAQDRIQVIHTPSYENPYLGLLFL